MLCCPVSFIYFYNDLNYLLVLKPHSHSHSSSSSSVYKYIQIKSHISNIFEKANKQLQDDDVSEADHYDDNDDIEGEGEFTLNAISFQALLTTFEPFLTYHQCNNDHVNISNKNHDAIFVDEEEEQEHEEEKTTIDSLPPPPPPLSAVKRSKSSSSGGGGERRSSFGLNFNSKSSIKSSSMESSIKSPQAVSSANISSGVEDSYGVMSSPTPHKKLSRKPSRRRSNTFFGISTTIGGGGGDNLDVLDDDIELHKQEDFATFAFIQSIFKMIDVDGDGFIDQTDLATWRRMLPVMSIYDLVLCLYSLSSLFVFVFLLFSSYAPQYY